MSDINGRQAVGHGVGGGNASIDGVAFARGAWGGWIDDRYAFFANGDDGWAASIYDTVTGTIARAIANPADPQYGVGFNTGFAGGGTWAAWVNLKRDDPRRGLYTLYGVRLPDAGLLGVGATSGALGYKPDYQSGGPSICYERDGSDWTITGGHAYDLQIVDRYMAIWQEGNRIRVFGLPQPEQVGRAWSPRAHLINGRWWVSYYSDVAGLVLHPFDSLDGIVVVPQGVDAWHSARAFGSIVLFATFGNEAEAAGTLRRLAFDTASVPLAPLEPDAPVTPPIDPPVDPPPIRPIDPPPVRPPIEPPPVQPPATPYAHHAVYAMRRR